MKRLDDFILKRNEIAKNYNNALEGLPLRLPRVTSGFISSFHLYVIRLELEEVSPKTHRQVFEDLRNRGIGVNVHYIPIHTQPYFRELGFRWGDFPIAEDYYKEQSVYLYIPV